MDNRNLCVWENLPEYARKNNLSVQLDKLTFTHRELLKTLIFC